MLEDISYELHSIECIKRLKARYFRAIDRKDWSALRDLFISNARLDGFWAAGESPTPDEFVTRISELFSSVTTTHHGFMPDIELVDRWNARGQWSLRDVMDWQEGSVEYRGKSLPGQRGVVGHGTYFDEYVLVDGRWLIAATRLHRERLEAIVGGSEELYDLSEGSPDS